MRRSSATVFCVVSCWQVSRALWGHLIADAAADATHARSGSAKKEERGRMNDDPESTNVDENNRRRSNSSSNVAFHREGDVSYANIIHTSSYSLLLTLPVPLSSTVVVALLSRAWGVEHVAAFASSSACINAFVSLLNYLSDGLTESFSSSTAFVRERTPSDSEASGGESAALHLDKRQWHIVGIKARIALVGSFVAGVFIFVLVYNCPLTLLRLLRCPDEALQEAEGYLKARALVAPVQVPSLPFPLERGGAGARSLLPSSTACPRLVSVPLGTTRRTMHTRCNQS